MSSKTEITPDEARAQLAWLSGQNDVDTPALRAELFAVLDAADEVNETDPARMIETADRLESWAAEYEEAGKDFQATENREIAARYRRCAARAMTANDNVKLGRAA